MIDDPLDSSGRIILALRPRPVDAAAFARYGDLIEPAAAIRVLEINDGKATRYHDLARIAPGPGGRAIVSIFRTRPDRAGPAAIAMMERHPLGSQAFVPIGGGPWFIVVAPPADAVDPATIEAFVVRGDQGVNLAPGVWHHPLIAIGAERDFLVIDRDGDGANCDIVAIDPPLPIRLSAGDDRAAGTGAD